MTFGGSSKEETQQPPNILNIPLKNLSKPYESVIPCYVNFSARSHLIIIVCIAVSLPPRVCSCFLVSSSYNLVQGRTCF